MNEKKKKQTTKQKYFFSIKAQKLSLLFDGIERKSYEV